jgi:hypothetical protein
MMFHRQGHEPECEKFPIENAVLFIDASVIMEYRLLVNVHSQQTTTTPTTSGMVLNCRSLVLSIFTFLWSIRIIYSPLFVKPGTMSSAERFLHAWISSLKDRTCPQRACGERISMILRVVGIGHLLDPCWHRAIPSHLSDPSSSLQAYNISLSLSFVFALLSQSYPLTLILTARCVVVQISPLVLR